MSFPTDFIWGVSTSAHQIEGASREDGKGMSVWDVFSDEGRILNDDRVDVSCDHYHRYAEDTKIMRDLGINGHRFSISWTRVLPDGTGTVNERGLSHYERMVDEMLANGVEPFASLFHWDLPLALHRRGGWMNRDIADWFAEYATVVVDRLSDRIKHWLTLNEPSSFINGGYIKGEKAPGLMLGEAYTIPMSHNVLLSHGKAVQAIRAAARTDCRVGFAPVMVTGIPATETEADIAAATEYTFGDVGRALWTNSWWMEPAYLGRYPEAGLERYASYLPDTWESDLETIAAPLDFIGANIYTGTTVRADDGGYREVERETGYPMTAIKWPVTPRAIYWGPRLLSERYRLPIYITENGMSSTDWVCLDGKVHDGARVDFLSRYLIELERAIDDGVDVRGYFHWSLMDNLNNNHGFRERFGFVHVDFETQKRTIKDSGSWYRKIIESNGHILH